MVKYVGEWFEWYIKLESGGLGYPDNYDLTIPRGSGTGKTIVPLVQPPKHLSEIDGAMRIIRRRRGDLWQILVERYTAPGSVDDKIRKLNISRSAYHARVRCAEEWLDGHLSRGA